MTQDCPPQDFPSGQSWASMPSIPMSMLAHFHFHGTWDLFLLPLSSLHCIVIFIIIMIIMTWFEFCKEIMRAGNLDGLRGHHWLLPSHGEPNLYSTKKVLLIKYHPEIPIHPTFIARFTWWWSGCWSLPFSSPSPSTDSSLLATPTGEIARIVYRELDRDVRNIDWGQIFSQLKARILKRVGIVRSSYSSTHPLHLYSYWKVHRNHKEYDNFEPTHNFDDMLRRRIPWPSRSSLCIKCPMSID